MAKETEKNGKSTPPNGRKAGRPAASGDSRTSGSGAVPRPMKPATGTRNGEIKVTVRTPVYNTKAVPENPEKRKLQVPLFDASAGPAQAPVQPAEPEASTAPPAPRTPEPPQEPSDVPRRLSDTLQKISAMSQELHEEKQVDLQKRNPDNQPSRGGLRPEEVPVKAAPEPVQTAPKPENDTAPTPVAAAPVEDVVEQPVQVPEKETLSEMKDKKSGLDIPGKVVTDTQEEKAEPSPRNDAAAQPIEKMAPPAAPRTSVPPVSPVPDISEPKDQSKPLIDEKPAVPVEASVRPVATPVARPAIPPARPAEPKPSGTENKPASHPAGEVKPPVKATVTQRTAARPEESVLQAIIAVLEKKRKRMWWWLALSALGAAVIGAAVGGWQTYRWYDANNPYKREIVALKGTISQAEKEKEKLTLQIDEGTRRLNNMQLGLNQMNKLFEESAAPPDKPQYQKAGDSIVLYWVDGMLWRRYHVYQARGRNGEFKKLNKRSTKKTFLYLNDLKPGVWRFAVTAMDREGKETEMSDPLEIKISP